MDQSVTEIVKKARKKLSLNQKDFGKTIEKTQCSVSRYESGGVLPPSAVIMHCMNILNNSPAIDRVEDLKAKISLLRGDEHSKFREALNMLLDSYFSSCA